MEEHATGEDEFTPELDSSGECTVEEAYQDNERQKLSQPEDCDGVVANNSAARLIPTTEKDDENTMEAMLEPDSSDSKKNKFTQELEDTAENRSAFEIRRQRRRENKVRKSIAILEDTFLGGADLACSSSDSSVEASDTNRRRVSMPLIESEPARGFVGGPQQHEEAYSSRRTSFLTRYRVDGNAARKQKGPATPAIEVERPRRRSMFSSMSTLRSTKRSETAADATQQPNPDSTPQLCSSNEGNTIVASG